MITRSAISRRTFLHGSGVSLALPFLEAMMPRLSSAAAAAPPKRMVFACASLGIYGPSLFPKETGRGYTLTPYLEAIKDHRDDFTVLSGVCHPDQAGADGHTSEMTWLTSARGPGLGGFRNTVSIDQFVAEKIGFETRYPSLVLSSAGQSSQSYTRSGVMVQAQSKPSQVFAKLFLDGTPLDLTTIEFKLLTTLMENDSTVHSRADLLRDVWGYNSDVATRTLDTHIKRLREKLGAAGEHIVTIRGTGFQFQTELPASLPA